MATVGSSVVAVPVEVTRTINLEPFDWYRATFRPRKPLERGEAQPFDQDACVASLSKLRTETSGYVVRWQDLKLPAALSPEEAHFWLEAMTNPRDCNVTPKALAEKLAKKKYTGDIDVAAAIELLKRKVLRDPDEIATALVTLLSVDGYLDLVFSMPSGKGTNPHFARAFALRVFPFLTDEELQAARRRLRKDWDPTKSPSDFYQAMPVEYYLAAALGMHDEVYAVTSTWADDRYSGDAWHDHYHRPQDIVFGLGTPELVASEWRRLKLRMRNSEHVRAFLACTEYSALDCVKDSVLAETNKERCEELLKAFALVNAPEAAEPMLECKLSSKMPGIARDWLDQNPGNAIAGLIPTAAGRGKLAEAAIEYLRTAKRLGHAKWIAECLKHVKDTEVSGKVRREVLDHEERTYAPLDAKTTPEWLAKELTAVGNLKAARLPAWAAPALLPPLVVGEKRLSDEHVGVVLKLLAATPVGQAHPLLAAIREHVNRHVRDEFAWKLFQGWSEGGSPSKEKWAMGAIGHLGGDGCALRLTPLVRAWPGESQHQRAVFGLECLRAIGSDVALMQLAGVAQKLKFKGLKSKAEQFVNEIAAERGMTRAELEDRVVPGNCGLDEQGRREFSFGARSFSFVLGGDLKAMLRDADGKLRSDLPKPGGKDDAAIAEQSVADWKLLKKQVKEVAQIQAQRLEQAMVTGRRWKVEEFVSLLVKHPLMTHLARQLIWGAFDKKGCRVATLRVTEERDCADAKDNALSLAGAETVGVLHPLELSEAERAAWGEVLSDYEIVAPFPQLGRAVYALEPGEAKEDNLSRFRGLTLVAPTLVFTLEKLGWIRGVAMDAGCFTEHSKQFPAAGVTAIIDYEGTVGMGYISPDETLTLTSCQFVPGLRAPSGYGWDKKQVLKLGDVPPVVISEVLADLHVLKSKSK